MNANTCNECQSYLDETGKCPECSRKKAFADFAGVAGLSGYPDPRGERYIFFLDGRIIKKSECPHYTEELWNALVRTYNGDKSLLLE